MKANWLFLDVLITRVGSSFNTSVYRKPTFSGLYSHYESFMPRSYKAGLLYTLLHRAFILCSTWESFHEEVCTLRHTFLKNAYPGFFIDKAIKFFLEKIFVAKQVFLTVPQIELRICLPYLGKQSLELKSKMQKFVHKYFPQCKIQVIFKCNNRFQSFLGFKDRVPNNLCSHLLYTRAIAARLYTLVKQGATIWFRFLNTLAFLSERPRNSPIIITTNAIPQFWIMSIVKNVSEMSKTSK